MPRVFDVYVTADTSIPTTGEVIAVTLNDISTDDPQAKVVLIGRATVSPGTGGTAVNLRIRRGSATTSPLVGELVAHAVSAGANSSATIVVEDVPGEVFRQAYVLTVEQVGATGSGTIANASLTALVDV
jgi:hypothetical protein